MSNDYSPSRGRDTRRGRRRQRRRGASSTKPNTTSQNKLSLWSRIAAFFGIGSKSGQNKPGRSDSSPSPKADKSQRADSTKATGKEQRPGRPVVQLEVTSPRLYVGNLSFDATESDLFELFSGAGSVVNVEVVCSRQTERSKGFAFVQMQTIEEARRAVEELHDKEFMGRKLLVSGARPAENRSERPPSQAES